MTVLHERHKGSTWNTELIEEIGQAIALEARSVGVDTAFSPVLNMWVDSRFGRLQEGYSENPTLTAAYAAAQTRGLQGVQPPGVWDYFNQVLLLCMAVYRGICLFLKASFVFWFYYVQYSKLYFYFYILLA